MVNRVKWLVPPLTQAQADGLIGQMEMANTNLERGQMAQARTYLQINALTNSGETALMFFAASTGTYQPGHRKQEEEHEP